jgi:hypothetical protein
MGFSRMEASLALAGHPRLSGDKSRRVRSLEELTTLQEAFRNDVGVEGYEVTHELRSEGWCGTSVNANADSQVKTRSTYILTPERLMN